MSLSLTNRDDIIANSYSLITPNGVVNLVDATRLSLVGAAPLFLNTIDKLADAIGNDAFFSESVDGKLANKADASAVFEKTILPYTETLTMLNKKITSTANFGANKLTIAIQDTVGVVSDAWFDGFSVELDTETKQVRCMAAGALLVGTTDVMSTLNNKATIAQLNNYYTATSIDTKLSKQVNYEYDIDSKLNTISLNKIQALDRLTATGPPLIDIQSDTRIIGTLNVTNDLTVANTNVLAAINSKPSTAALNLKAPIASPQFTGTGTFVNLAVSTQLMVGIVDVMATLNNKAPLRNPSFLGQVACEDAVAIGGVLTVSGARDNITSNITNTQLNGSTSLSFNNTSGASASEVGRIFCGQSAGLNLCTNTTHPIKFTTYTNDVSVAPSSMQILGTGTRDVEISAPLKIKCLLTTIEQAVVIGGSAPAEATGLYVSNNGVINGGLTVVGNLAVGGFYPVKPYIGVSVNGALGTLSTATKPGYLTPTLAKTATGVFVFTLPTPHPSGTNYIAFVQQRKTLVTDAAAIYSVNIISSTQFTVWSTNISNVLVDSFFYLHTVP